MTHLLAVKILCFVVCYHALSKYLKFRTKIIHVRNLITCQPLRSQAMLYQNSITSNNLLPHSIKSKFRINMFSNPNGTRIYVGCHRNLLESTKFRASHGRHRQCLKIEFLFSYSRLYSKLISIFKSWSFGLACRHNLEHISEGRFNVFGCGHGIGILSRKWLVSIECKSSFRTIIT